MSEKPTTLPRIYISQKGWIYLICEGGSGILDEDWLESPDGLIALKVLWESLMKVDDRDEEHPRLLNAFDSARGRDAPPSS